MFFSSRLVKINNYSLIYNVLKISKSIFRTMHYLDLKIPTNVLEIIALFYFYEYKFKNTLTEQTFTI